METNKDVHENVENAAGKQQLVQEIRAKQAALESKSRLIDNMAYQIRTLSNAIIGFSDLLFVEDLSDGQKEYVSEIYQAGKALSALVNDVVDLAKLESGKLVVAKNICSLAELLDEFYHAIIPAVQQKHLDFSIIADADIPGQIYTDSDRLLKCLLNLTSNAIIHTSKGCIRVSISLTGSSGSKWFRFDVQDSGTGIDKEKLGTIFDEVVQMENANRGVLSSLDLGMTIAGSLPVTKRLAEILGGQVEAASQPGSGSTFSILIPAENNVLSSPKLDISNIFREEEIHAKAESALQSSPASVSGGPSRGKILLVEDQESNRMVITLLLETLGLEVLSAEDGVEAVAAVESNSFDVILMDLMLPRMNGFEAAEIIRRKNIKTPIIALSAGVINEQDTIRLKNSFEALLAKPVDSKKLQQTLRQYLPKLESDSAAAQAESSSDEFVIEYTND